MEHMRPRIKKLLKICLSLLAILALSGVYYYRTHPLVFNESFFDHAHCIVGAGLSFRMYAGDHGGGFPYSTNGYGDALVMVNDGADYALTGPGYDTKVFERVRHTGKPAPDNEFGRVYVQSLSETNDPEIVLLFDKLPTPGGDHCHLFQRFTAPLCREVCFVSGSHQTIKETDWPAFSQHQIELLVAAGIPKSQAEKYYSEKPKL
jgi:hypothetical protein